MVAWNMLSNYWKRNKEYKTWHLVRFSYPHWITMHGQTHIRFTETSVKILLFQLNFKPDTSQNTKSEAQFSSLHTHRAQLTNCKMSSSLGTTKRCRKFPLFCINCTTWAYVRPVTVSPFTLMMRSPAYTITSTFINSVFTVRYMETFYSL